MENETNAITTDDEHIVAGDSPEAALDAAAEWLKRAQVTADSGQSGWSDRVYSCAQVASTWTYVAEVRAALRGRVIPQVREARAYPPELGGGS